MIYRRNPIMDWWRRRQRRRRCFHHDRYTSTSWIADRIIDWRKIYWCTKCDKTWII